MKQLSRDEAIALYESGDWGNWTDMQRASFQMVQDCLCMPFNIFHKSIEAVLGRPIFTHEFGMNREGLTRELAGLSSAPSMEEIMALIPAEKLLVIESGSCPAK